MYVSIGLTRTGQCRPSVSKRYEIKVRMVWVVFLIAAAALKTPTRKGSNAQGVNLTVDPRSCYVFGEQDPKELGSTRCC